MLSALLNKTFFIQKYWLPHLFGISIFFLLCKTVKYRIIGGAIILEASPNGAVAKSLANGLVGTGFASRYRLQP